MTNQELKEKLFKIATECDELGRKIGRLMGAIDAEEELKKDYKSGIFTFVISERGAGRKEFENGHKKRN
mgnify:CR=1 FL=1